METEGRAKTVKLRCFRKPSFARSRGFQGETINELLIVDDGVIIDISALEIIDVELRFAKDS